ncbi:FAD-dependent oxidoreductase [Streptomyces platensis]|uniref:FAD-dependent oxidoreductase n=1 Tax=Streptomyces platensis TaxID=58346 RepID=UPI0037A4B2BA
MSTPRRGGYGSRSLDDAGPAGTTPSVFHRAERGPVDAGCGQPRSDRASGKVQARPPGGSIARSWIERVTVIGGGVAGLSCAWELTRAGRRDGAPGSGPDRRRSHRVHHSQALLTAHSRLRAVAPNPRSRRRPRLRTVPAASRRTGRRDRGTAGHRVRAGAVPRVHLRPRPFRDRRAAVRGRCCPGSWPDRVVRHRDRAALPVAGAVRVENQAQFHPRKYLLGLAEDLRARDGIIHERTRATGLSEGVRCRVATESGAVVTSQDVIVATHYRSSTAPCSSPGFRRAANLWWRRRSRPIVTPAGCTSPRRRANGRCAPPRTARGNGC